MEKSNNSNLDNSNFDNILNDSNFSLTTYINSKHRTDSLRDLNYSLNNLQIDLDELKPTLDVLVKNNVDLLPNLIDAQNTLKDIKKDIKKSTNIQQKDKTFKEFKDVKNIKRFQKILTEFQENLDMFINESRKLEIYKKVKVISIEGKSFKSTNTNKNSNTNFRDGIIVMSNDLIIIGVKKNPALNKYNLESNFNYEMMEIVFEEDIIKTTDEFCKVKIVSPSSIFTIKSKKKDILEICNVFEKYSSKKDGENLSKRNLEEQKKLETNEKLIYLIKTEQFEKIKLEEDLMESLSTLNLQEPMNVDELKFKRNVLNSETLKLLFQKIKTKKIFLLMKDVIDDYVLFYSIFKTNFPTIEVNATFLDTYFSYYDTFMEEQKEFIDEELEILLQEKYIEKVIEKSMKQILWKGRKIDDAKRLIKELENKCGYFCYLMNDYNNAIKKFYKLREDKAKDTLNDLVNEFVLI